MKFVPLAFVLLAAISFSVVRGDLADNTQFMFFHGSTFDENEVYAFANVTSISEHPNFNPEKPTVLYCHGYLEAPPNESIHLIVDSYLQRNDHNVVILDWSRLVTGDYLLTAAPNAIAVAPTIAQQLVKWFAQGLNINNFHLVGHSLGGQLAGMIGRNVMSSTKGDMKLRRITGLDPANPPFFPFLFMLALSKTDAYFVDVIHTDAGLYGAPVTSGTVDFWPNGGDTLQPGCPSRNFKPLTDNDNIYALGLTSMPIDGATIFAKAQAHLNWPIGFERIFHTELILDGFQSIAIVKRLVDIGKPFPFLDLCSHRRSWRFWAESLTAPPGTAFPAVNADSYFNFKRGSVDRNQIAMMGIECSTNLGRGQYYLQTNAQLPFSRGMNGTVYDPSANTAPANLGGNSSSDETTSSSAA